MSNIKDLRCKRGLHVSVNLLGGRYGRHIARLRRRRRRRAHAPTSNTPSHDNHEKINLWILFSPV